MRFITSGHFTANVDVYSEDQAFVEVTMTSKLYADQHLGFDDELADELRTLERRVKDYIQYAQRLCREDAEYAV